MSKKYRIKKAMFSTLSSLYERLYGVDLDGYTDNERTTVTSSYASDTDQKYELRNAKAVNTKLTRNLYHNRDNKYVLAAHLVKPIVNNLVSFTDEPEFISNNKKLNSVFDSFKIPYDEVHRIAERDGDVFVWPQWDIEEDNIKFVVIPPEVVKEIWLDPVTKKHIGYKFRERMSYSKEDNVNAYADLTFIITADKIERKFIVDGKETVNRVKNPFGFIPIIQFANDKESYELRGHSELENIEPLLKFYHDMTLDAGSTQHRDGRPKTKVTTDSPKTWLNNNFGDGTWEAVASGKAKVSMQDRDLYINRASEDIQYIESNKATGDYSKLSEIAFMNLVEGSETPEILFGANMGTNLSAAIEQRPIWRKKVKKHQKQYNDSWYKLITNAFKIYSFATFSKLIIDFDLKWPDPDFASTKEKADALNVMSNALVKLKEFYLMSNEEIHDTLNKADLVIVENDFNKHDKQVSDTVEKMAERRAKTEPKKETADSSGINDNNGKPDGDSTVEEDPDEETDVDGGKTNG